jgi:hypothetical protein
VAELEAVELGELGDDALGDGDVELAAADDEGAAEPPPKQPESASRRANPSETGMVRGAPIGAHFNEPPRGPAFMRQG